MKDHYTSLLCGILKVYDPVNIKKAAQHVGHFCKQNDLTELKDLTHTLGKGS